MANGHYFCNRTLNEVRAMDGRSLMANSTEGIVSGHCRDIAAKALGSARNIFHVSRFSLPLGEFVT
jgi:hypothetical protein